MRFPLSTLALLLLLAGCAGPSAPPDEAPTDGPAADAAATGSAVAVAEVESSWSGETWGSYCAWTDPVMPGCFGVHSTSESARHTLRLPEGAEKVSVEFTWAANDPRTERLRVVALQGGGVLAEKEGASPLAFEVPVEGRGTLDLYVSASRLAGAPAQAHDPQPFEATALVTVRGEAAAP